MNALLAWLWGRGDVPGLLGFFRFSFTVVSWFYAWVSALRRWFYLKGVFPQKRVACHVVSIGNMTAGGTGKTPITIYFAEQWYKKGMKVGIVSRGYRRKNKAAVVLVSEGMGPCTTPDAVGDEPYLMAERLKGVPIVVAADRFLGCQELIARFGVEVILLDDGFQHLRLHRDLNLLIIDAANPFGNGHLLPRGPLREPISQIKRADWVIFTRVDEGLAMEELMRRVALFQTRMIKSRFEATHLIDLCTHECLSPSVLSGKRVLPFCGIGNPEAFLKQLALLGAKPEHPHLFEDHHDYQADDLAAVRAAAETAGIEWLVTTEKDAVKIKAFLPIDRPIARKVYALRIGPVFTHDVEPLFSRLFEK